MHVGRYDGSRNERNGKVSAAITEIAPQNNGHFCQVIIATNYRLGYLSKRWEPWRRPRLDGDTGTKGVGPSFNARGQSTSGEGFPLLPDSRPDGTAPAALRPETSRGEAATS